MERFLPVEMDFTQPDPREKKGYVLHITPLRRVLTPALRGLFWLFARLKVSGLENLPKSGPVVLIANHLTNIDVIAMQLAIPRSIFFMGKEELFRNPVFEMVIRQMGAFPVYRGARDEWALHHARRLLELDQVLGMFPEGTRSRGQGLRTAKPGAARLALEIGCPVSPMAIDGTQRLFTGFPRRIRITVKIGEPVIPVEDELPLELTDRVMFALADLLPVRLRGVYAQRPPGF